MIDAALSAALTRLDQAIDAVDAAASSVGQLSKADSDSVLRQEVRAAIAELDAMLGRTNG
jgi:hypothetical protein